MKTESVTGRIGPTSRVRSLTPLVVGALLVAACGGEGAGAKGAPRDPAGAAGAAASGGTDSMPGMAGMPGMGQAMSGPMMTDMEAHLRAMRAATPDSLRRALRTHRQLVANLVAQMNREMGDMHMVPDASWTALVDSVRADLTRMPELGAEELSRSMPGHHGRVARLIAAHRGMMGSMRR